MLLNIGQLPYGALYLLPVSAHFHAYEAQICGFSPDIRACPFPQFSAGALHGPDTGAPFSAAPALQGRYIPVAAAIVQHILILLTDPVKIDYGYPVGVLL